MRLVKVKHQTPNRSLDKKYILVIMAMVLLIFSPILPIPEHMGDKGWVALGILMLCIILWGTQLIPAPITSFVAVALTALFGIMSFDEAASELGNETIWLIISMLILGTAVEKTSLDKRLAFSFLSLARGHVKKILLCLVFLAFFLTFFIPNAIGRMTLLLPIGLGVIHSMEKQAGKNFAKSVMLLITTVPYFSTIALITGASGSIYAAGLFESVLGFNWSYLHWMIVMMPITIIVLFLYWIILWWLFPTNISVIPKGENYFLKEKEKLGNMSKQEYKLITLYFFLILLWMTKNLHHISISLSAVVVTILLFIPGIRLVEWKETMKKMDWGIPLLFAAGFTLSNALDKSGFVDWILSWSTLFLDGLSAFSLAITVMIIFVIIRLGFTNYTAMVASLMPIALTFALSTPYNPIWIGMLCLVASSIAFIFPTQSVGSLITLPMGYYTGRDMMVSGSILTLLILIVTILFAFFYWPLVGITIY